MMKLDLLIQTLSLVCLQAAVIHCFVLAQPQSRPIPDQSDLGDTIDQSSFQQLGLRGDDQPSYSPYGPVPLILTMVRPDRGHWRYHRRPSSLAYQPHRSLPGQFDRRNKRTNLLEPSTLGDYATHMAISTYARLLGNKNSGNGNSRRFPG